MWKFMLLLLTMLLPLSGFSAPQSEIHLWPGQVIGEDEPKHEPVKTPDRNDNVIRLTDVTDPLIKVFEPERSKNNGAGIIVCPGGGYHILAIDKEGYEVAEWLTDLGYTAFVLQYRVPQKQAGALMDIQRAIRIVRSKAYLWKLDIDKIGVMGFSAGAHLAARACTQFNTETYPKVDDADLFSTRPNFAMSIYGAYFDKGENKTLSPELTIQKETPSMFIFGTADDKSGNSSLVMTSALRNAEIPVELHFLANGGHGYGLRKGNVAAETWPGLAGKWLNNLFPAKQENVISEKELENAPEKLVSLMNELAADEENPLLKRHFESIAFLTADTSHGFQITDDNKKQAYEVLQFFHNKGTDWQTYADGPRPLIMSFKSATDGKTSFYKLFLPKYFDPQKTDYPFYMELHGSGGGKNDNPRQLLYMSLQPEIKGVTSQGYRKEGLFIYPWGRGDKRYRGIAETDIVEVLADFDASFKTDPKRQYLYGFSMGGGGSFKFAQKTMDRWAAVGMYSGAIFNPSLEEAKKFKNTPVWMAWGELERLAAGNRELQDLFVQVGVELKWMEIDGVKHSYLGEYQEDLLDWFKTKVKE